MTEPISLLKFYWYVTRSTNGCSRHRWWIRLSCQQQVQQLQFSHRPSIFVLVSLTRTCCCLQSILHCGYLFTCICIAVRSSRLNESETWRTKDRGHAQARDCLLPRLPTCQAGRCNLQPNVSYAHWKLPLWQMDWLPHLAFRHIPSNFESSIRLLLLSPKNEGKVGSKQDWKQFTYNLMWVIVRRHC